ncbi:hypothetical protein ACRU3B_10690 [Mycobacterium colombiense]
MTTTTPTAGDYVKHTAAEGIDLLSYVEDRLGWLIDDDAPINADDEVEVLQDMLYSVRKMLRDTAARFGDPYTYTDGRQVETSIEMELGNYYTHRWHPQTDHPDNRARTVLDRCECTSGYKHSVLVVTDQILDTVHHGRGLHLVETSS